MSTTVKDLGWENIKREILILSKCQVMCGVQSNATTKKGQSMAVIAAANEFGTSKIPSRPFIRQSFDRNKSRIMRFCSEVGEKVLANRVGGLQGANLCGQFMTAIIQTEITDGGWKPNAPITIKRKGSDKPLIDTGRLRQSIRHVVKRK